MLSNTSRTTIFLLKSYRHLHVRHEPALVSKCSQLQSISSSPYLLCFSFFFSSLIFTWSIPLPSSSFFSLCFRKIWRSRTDQHSRATCIGFHHRSTVAACSSRDRADWNENFISIFLPCSRKCFSERSESERERERERERRQKENRMAVPAIHLYLRYTVLTHLQLYVFTLTNAYVQKSRWMLLFREY